MAVLLAKKPTAAVAVSPNPFLPIPLHFILMQIWKFSISNWKEYWSGRPDCKQTKLWLPKPYPNISKDLLNLALLEFGSSPDG